MENNLKQLNKFKDIKLSESEKAVIRSRLALVMSREVEKKQSLFQRTLYHTLRISLSSLAFFIFVGGMVSAIADQALPGDPLYAFKLNVNEEVKGFFKNTPEEKVAYGAKRVETRVKEIQTLADSKSLTKEKQLAAQKAIDAHIEDLSTNLKNLSATAPNTALVATAKLEESLKANKADLVNTEVINNEAKEDALSTVNGTIQKVSNQEIKIISKEIDSISSDLASVTPPSILTPATDENITKEEGKQPSEEIPAVVKPSPSTSATPTPLVP